MVKFELLYFKNLIDLAFVKFCEDFNDSFQKNEKDQYVLSKNFSETKITQEFKKNIIAVLNETTVKYDRFNPTYYIIIGACLPKDNMLLKFKKPNYFPNKLEKLINADYQIKYLLKEKDIKIDIIQFNNICNSLFNAFFSQKKIKFSKSDVRDNILFVQHKNLDCYTIFKYIKHEFGKSNCINMHKEKFKDVATPIVAINDLIDRYVNKTAMNTSSQMKIASKELIQYLNERIFNI